MRIRDVLKFKRDLVHETRAHHSAYAQMIISSFSTLNVLSDLEKEGIKNVVSHMGLPALEYSDVFYMGSDVMSEYMNRSLGPEPKQWGTIPPYTKNGILCFERPMPIDPHKIISEAAKMMGSEQEEYDIGAPASELVPISAMSWSTGSVPTSRSGDGAIVWKPGGVIMLWSRSHDIRSVFLERTGEDIGEALYSAYPLTYASAAYGGWFIAESGISHPDEDLMASIYYDGDQPETASPSTAVALCHTLWRMLAEEIAVANRRDVSKKYKKMARRVNMKDTGVSVITLRHVQNVSDNESYDGDRIIDWSHRWYVRGHYRRIRDRRTGQERLVWVRSHIKGPQEKPLRETEKIYALTR